MKNSIIYLGLALVAFANSATADTTLAEGIAANHLTVAAVKAEQFENSLTAVATEKGKFSPVEDKTVLNPETVVNVNNDRPIEEVIAENNKITESTIADEGILFFFETPTEEVIAQDNKIIESNIDTEIRPVYLEKTVEDTIAEDNAIIEGSVPNEVANLDFEKINSSDSNKEVGTKATAGLNE